MQPEELSTNKLTRTNEESCGDPKDEDVPKEVMLAKAFTLKELLELLSNGGSSRDKMLSLLIPFIYFPVIKYVSQGDEKYCTGKSVIL